MGEILRCEQRHVKVTGKAARGRGRRSGSEIRWAEMNELCRTDLKGAGRQEQNFAGRVRGN